MSMKKSFKKLQSKTKLRVDESPEQSSTPSDPSSASYDVAPTRSRILAFRTITSMLSLIQSPTVIINTIGKDLSKDEHHEMRVLDALSAVSVLECVVDQLSSSKTRSI